MRFEVCLIHRQVFLRNCLATFLEERLSFVNVLESTAIEEITAADDCPDLILLEAQLYNSTLREYILHLRKRGRHATVVFLSAETSPAITGATEACDAAAIIYGSASAKYVVDLVRRILWTGGDSGLQEIPSRDIPRLTDRQREVLNLLCQGLSNKAIGKYLNLSDNTVRGHVAAILSQLSVSNRTMAIIEARRIGLISL